MRIENCNKFRGPIPIFNKEIPHSPNPNSDSEPIPKADNELSPKTQLKTDSFFFMRSKRMNVPMKSSVERRESSLVSVLCNEKNENNKQKFFYFFKAFLLPHFFAFGLTILRVLLQGFEGTFCWLKKICSCQNFQSKIYSIFAMMLSSLEKIMH